jgi:UDP-glucuronate 4-epimerase
MTTLVTGGAGFIGSRLAQSLLDSGERVVIIDNFNDFYDPAIKRNNIRSLRGQFELIEGDIRDVDLIQQTFRRYPIQRVAHLAAMANVRASVNQGRLYSDVNVSATVSLLDEARKHSVEVFLLASTSSVYGNTTRIPFVETDDATLPLAPYPASKRAAELFAHSFHNLFGLNVNVVRFFNVYGPHGRPDMMPLRALDAILADEPITLFDGGSLQRDWTYIDDIVDGVQSALFRPLGYQIFNLGCGAPVSLNEFIHTYEMLLGRKARVQEEAAPLTEPRITYCDNQRARTHLGFRPRVQLAEGLARTLDWYLHGDARKAVAVGAAR